MKKALIIGLALCFVVPVVAFSQDAQVSETAAPEVTAPAVEEAVPAAPATEEASAPEALYVCSSCGKVSATADECCGGLMVPMGDENLEEAQQ